MNAMNDIIRTQQAAAHANPCFYAEETVNRIFGGRLPPPFDWLTFNLTANIGLE
jgi:hypothetical protein